MKAVIIGCFGHYGYIWNGMKKYGVELAAVTEGVRYDPNIYSPEIYSSDDYIKILDEIKPDIAVICDIFSRNSEIAVSAIEHGCHVFLEKPAATDFDKLNSLKKISNKNPQLKICPMFGIRYESHFVTAKRLVDEGVIGNIRLINAQKSYKMGSRPEFYRKRQTYGGIIPWVAIHAIDWVHWFSNSKFLSVTALHSCRENFNHGEMETTSFSLFNMKNEIIASVSADMLRPSDASSHDDDRIRIVGTDGIIEIINKRVFLTGAGKTGTDEINLDSPHDIFCDMLEQIINGTNSDLTAENAFYITEAALNARLSADTNQTVYFN